MSQPLTDAQEQEIKGKVLALQSDGSLSYAIDHDPAAEASLSAIAGLAIQTLGANNAPFVLVIHDTLLPKAADVLIAID